MQFITKSGKLEHIKIPACVEHEVEHVYVEGGSALVCRKCQALFEEDELIRIFKYEKRKKELEEPK